jgi:hypothetical protein
MTHNPHANAHPVGGRPWSAEEDAIVLKGIKAGERYADIAVNTSRTVHALKARARYLGLSLAERRAIRAQRVRPKTIAMRIDHVVERAPVIPEEVLQDRLRRSMAPRSLTAILCGDPEPCRRRL